MEFKDAVKFVLEIEGGFVDNPNDKGRATKYGITRQTLSVFKKDSSTYQDIKNLTLDDAIEIYHRLFWLPLNLDLLSSAKMRAVIFDRAVLFGIPNAVKMLQQTLCKLNQGVTKDGILGSETLKALNSVNSDSFIKDYLRRCIMFHVEHSKKEPSQLEFLRGWITRVFRLQDLIHNFN